MLPTPLALLTVTMPSWTIHWAGEWSCAETHSSRFFPSKRMMASEGGAPHSPGVTTAGSGDQTSVSSGFGADCCAINLLVTGEAATAIHAMSATSFEKRMFVILRGDGSSRGRQR